MEAARMSATARWEQGPVADSAVKRSALVVTHAPGPAEATLYA